MGWVLPFFLYADFIALTISPHIMPIPTTAATPRMLHRMCLGFKSDNEKLFLAANVVSNVGQNDTVMFVM